ncbi:hypothetical protein JF75_03940 [Lactobacillus kimbladii]|uniref:Uncharacterized protein n=2 Tax=Lactobacillus TaxID=1578 RepID=A0A0F4LGH7_9LACO|nr:MULTISPECIES: hypothetical protein [Lactobacillus]KJY57379.1 hypothetical protein JF74_04020 [Lactobacillus melliventris]KJY59359.1 hypothetical protein JF75_03940 [Lactobacillus kimbladii]NUE98439.1 hypothetical protein [Lactobacillus melliventris]PXY83985.1 hypothetical protein DK873_02025 [Lactobacillus melliventris]RMC59315.1 hypothetical protein F5ESL0260_02000 [Lactobacillus sp. ESL0260]
MPKLPRIPSTLAELINSYKKEKHISDIQVIKKINSLIENENDKIQYKVDRFQKLGKAKILIPSTFSDWTNLTSKNPKRPINGVQRQAIANLLNKDYIETIFANGAEIIPFMDKVFSYICDVLTKIRDTPKKRKFPEFKSLNQETLKEDLIRRGYEQIATLIDPICTYEIARNFIMFETDRILSNIQLTSVVTWLKINYDTSIGRAGLLTPELFNTINSGEAIFPKFYAFNTKVPIELLNKSYIDNESIYNFLILAIKKIESLLLRNIFDENQSNSLDKNFKFLRYKNLYKSLSKEINQLNTMPRKETKAIINSVIGLIKSLISKIAKIGVENMEIINNSGYAIPPITSITSAHIIVGKTLLNSSIKETDEEIIILINKFQNSFFNTQTQHT